MAVLTSPGQEPLLARYRRVLTFADVLDESIRLFRQHWTSLAVLSAVALLPPGLLGIWLSASGVLGASFTVAELQSGRFAQPSTLAAETAAVLGVYVVSTLFFVLWSSAAVVAVDTYLRGGEPPLRSAYGTALARYWAALLATIVLLLALAVLTAVAVGLFVVTAFGVLGTLIALVLLVLWWLKPGVRKRWVKWLIVLVAPFGLPAYFLGRWSLYIPAAVLERHGPVSALARSSQLVDRHWFRLVSILSVAGLIVSVLQWAPATLIEIPLTFSSATRGQFGLAPAQAAIVNAVAVVLQIVFASIGSIAYTLAFVDLRNRREGADILERLSQLETEPVPTNE